MMVQMMVPTMDGASDADDGADDGTRHAAPRQACRWRCAASVTSDLGMRNETVNSAKKFDFEFQRKTKQRNHHSCIEHSFSDRTNTQN